jgi:hypothetical protein
MKRAKTTQEKHIRDLAETLWVAERLLRDCQHRIAAVISCATYTKNDIGSAGRSGPPARTLARRIAIRAVELIDDQFDENEFHLVFRSLLTSKERSSHRRVQSAALIRWLVQSQRIQPTKPGASGRRAQYCLSQGPPYAGRL